MAISLVFAENATSLFALFMMHDGSPRYSATYEFRHLCGPALPRILSDAARPGWFGIVGQGSSARSGGLGDLTVPAL